MFTGENIKRASGIHHSLSIAENMRAYHLTSAAQKTVVHHNKTAYHQNEISFEEIDAFLPHWTLISKWQFNEITPKPFIYTFQYKQYQLTYNSGVLIQIGFFGQEMDHMTFFKSIKLVSNNKLPNWFPITNFQIGEQIT